MCSFRYPPKLLQKDSSNFHSKTLQVLSYKDAIKDLENAGEINVKLSMHTIEKTEGSNDFFFKAQKKVCFVLDQPKESKRKKAQMDKTKEWTLGEAK